MEKTWVSANDYLAAVTEREITADAIAERLRLIGYDVTTERVLRKLWAYVEWDQERLALGRLVRMTGIRKVT